MGIKIKKGSLGPTRNAHDLIGKAEDKIVITNEDLYKAKIEEGMSDTYKAKAEEIASGEEDGESGDQSALANDTTQEKGPTDKPTSRGEESISGDMPNVASDDDALTNAKQVGTQINEDLEHPEEVDVGRDIDKAEEWHREH